MSINYVKKVNKFTREAQNTFTADNVIYVKQAEIKKSRDPHAIYATDGLAPCIAVSMVLLGGSKDYSAFCHLDDLYSNNPTLTFKRTSMILDRMKMSLGFPVHKMAGDSIEICYAMGTEPVASRALRNAILTWGINNNSVILPTMKVNKEGVPTECHNNGALFDMAETGRMHSVEFTQTGSSCKGFVIGSI